MSPAWSLLALGFLLLPSAAGAQTSAEPPLAPLPPGPPSSSTLAAPAASGSTEPAAASPIPQAPPPLAPEVPPTQATLTSTRFLHDGFYLGVGTGTGFVGIWGNGPNGSSSLTGLGSMAKIAIGGTLARGLALAGVIEGTSAEGTLDGGPTITATTVHFVNGQMQTSTGKLSGHAKASLALIGVDVDWFPDPSGGWHVGGSLGLAVVGVTDDANGTSTGVSLGVSLFGGYQWWLGRSWSLGLMGVVLGSPTVTQKDSNQDETGYRFTPLSVGVESLLLYY